MRNTNIQKDVFLRFHAPKGFTFFWCLVALFSLCAASVTGKVAAATDACPTVSGSVIPEQKPVDEAAKLKIQEDYGKIPLYFVRNDGQINEKVRFYEKGSGRNTFFTDSLSLSGGRQSKDKGREMASNQLAVGSRQYAHSIDGGYSTRCRKTCSPGRQQASGDRCGRCTGVQGQLLHRQRPCKVEEQYSDVSVGRLQRYLQRHRHEVLREQPADGV